MNNCTKHIKEKTVIILCTLPYSDQKITTQLIQTLLDHKLAACISLLPNIHSFYYWNNKFEKNIELQLFIKTHLSLKEKIFCQIKKIHPYKIPELLILPIIAGDTRYLKWIKSVLKHSNISI